MKITGLEVTESKIYCQRSTSLRIGFGIFGLAFGAVCLSLFVFFWPSAASLAERSPADILSRTASFLLVPLLGLCCPTALFLYYAGPADLIVDTDQRTYRFRRGFPLLASWKSGPLEDIADLRVSAVSSRSASSGNRSPSSYQLMLDWKNTQTTPWTLGNGAVASRFPLQMGVSRDLSGLQQEAQRLAQRMGVPVLDRKPVLEQARRRSQRLLTLIPIVFFCLAAGLPPLLAGRELESQGQEVSGSVTALHHSKSYTASYRYEVGHREFHGRATIPWSTYSDLDVGSPVTVRYLPSYPHTSTLAGSQNARSGLPLLILGGFLVVLILWASRAQRDEK